MKDYEMYCSDSFLIAAPGMAFFGGFAIGCSFLPKMSDENGRKNYFMVAMIAQTLSVLVCILVSLGSAPIPMGCFYVIIVMFFIHGLSTGIRPLVGFCMICDFCPEKYASYLGAFWNSMEGIIYIYLTIYFRFISKNWLWPQVFGVCLSFVTITLVYLWIPESPKWLYKKQRYEQCNVVFKRIAKFNGIDEMKSVGRLLLINPGDSVIEMS